MKICFPVSTTDLQCSVWVQNGNYIPLPMTSTQPVLSALPRVEKDTWYALVLFDPDAVGGNKIHWLLYDIHRTSGTTAIPYEKPNPPAGTGIHRYIFQLIRQPRKIGPLPRRRTVRHIPTALILAQIGVDPITVCAERWFVSSRVF